LAGKDSATQIRLFGIFLRVRLLAALEATLFAPAHGCGSPVGNHSPKRSGPNFGYSERLRLDEDNEFCRFLRVRCDEEV